MPCDEPGWQKEKPRSAKLAGVDGGYKTHAIWLRKRRDESSRSAMEASDCFQVLPGLVTRWASEKLGQLQVKASASCRQAYIFNRANRGDWYFLWLIFRRQRQDAGACQRQTLPDASFAKKHWISRNLAFFDEKSLFNTVFCISMQFLIIDRLFKRKLECAQVPQKTGTSRTRCLPRQHQRGSTTSRQLPGLMATQSKPAQPDKVCMQRKECYDSASE